jgi:hypothetical protein
MVSMAAGPFRLQDGLTLQDGPTIEIVGTIFRFFALILSSHRAGASRRILDQGDGANRRRNAMRLLMVAMAAALLAVSAAPAYSQVSQMGNPSSKPSQKPPEKKDQKSPEQKKAEEKAYNDAINRIPDGKFDPWRTVR